MNTKEEGTVDYLRSMRECGLRKIASKKRPEDFDKKNTIMKWHPVNFCFGLERSVTDDNYDIQGCVWWSESAWMQSDNRDWTLEVVAVKIGCLGLLPQKSQVKSNALLHLILTLAHFRCPINVTESNWILKQKKILQFKLEQILSGLFIWKSCFILSSIQ